MRRPDRPPRPAPRRIPLRSDISNRLLYMSVILHALPILSFARLLGKLREGEIAAHVERDLVREHPQQHEPQSKGSR